MGTRIIKQPKGKFGLFSTISGRIYAIDCDEQEMIRIWRQRGAERAEREMVEWLEQTKSGHFLDESMTLNAALKEHQFGNCAVESEAEFDKVLRKRKKKRKK